jgi:hypothetical protein
MQAPAYLWVYVVWGMALISFSILLGLAITLKAFGYPSRDERRSFHWAVGLLAGWVGLCVLLGIAGSATSVVGGPGVRLGLSAVVAAGIGALLLGTERGRSIVRAAPQAWLVGVQAYRGLGSMFLLLAGAGLVPGAFGLPAGFGDVAIGLLALPIAALYLAQSWSAWPLAAAWNVLGLADLVMAATLGVLSSPAVQLLPGVPNYLLASWPLNMIALFGVPVSAVLHIVSLAKLSWDRKALSSSRGGAVAGATA